VNPLSPDCEERFVRLGALLHDIGHLPAGHTLEDELGLVGQHDGDERLDKIFQMNGFGTVGLGTLEELIDTHFAKYVPADLNGRISPTNIVRMLVRKLPKDKDGKYDEASDKYKEVYNVLASSADIRLDVCANMIGNTICADLLDYLFRDWYHVGKPRTFDDRILQYMEIRTTAKGQSKVSDEATRAASDRFVVSLGKSPKIRTDGISAILELLEWRYQLAETVLFHRTKLAAAAMLDRAMFELWEDEREDLIIDAVLQLSDEQLVDKSIELADKKVTEASSSARVRFEISKRNLVGIRNRELFAELKTWGVNEVGEDLRDRIQALYGATAKQATLRLSHLVRRRN
jgi:HD superfamily phosphohydrolase